MKTTSSPEVTLKPQYQRGDLVTIYQDPFTCLKPEGTARLLTCLSHDPEIERWLVRFPDDGQSIERWVLPKSLQPAANPS